MKKILIYSVSFLALSSCAVKKTAQIKEKEVGRIIKTLSSDEMEGRGMFSPGIEKAASFIENEFKAAGLKPLQGESNFRQSVQMQRIIPGEMKVSINGKVVDAQNLFFMSDQPLINWKSTSSNVEIQFIKSNQSFTARYKEILALNKPVLVYVDEALYSAFKRFKDHYGAERISDTPKQTEAVFVLGTESEVKSFDIRASNIISKAPLFNVAGIIPGKSKSGKSVIFSAHYDHLGIIDPVESDSIANGADDDASGVTAVISLARHFKKLNNNEHTLIFVAFTAEEVGGFGSKHFSKQLNPDSIVAMFNIEMIGKESKFGKNSAFITGFEKSDFGTILQKNLEGTAFKFHPDPYPEQNLFYRSDNATLAALGVPAHTISTSQIDQDKLYHSVDDEFATLNLSNIRAAIEAIALSAKSIIQGTDTPSRIEKIK